MNRYVPTIGLEIHAELRTASKMFCPCKNDPDEETPNTNICPICMGHPGTLPVLNKEAIKKVLQIGIALGGNLADFTEWDRKNYFYPDIPKGYQISQYQYPLIQEGELSSIALERIHLEEDTAQSTHDTHENSLVNFNRAGVPLMELVTKPVIRDAKTAVTFAKELQLLLRTLDAGHANLEKGEMRVEANVSVASAEDTEALRFGTKTEIKNLNSFRAVERAIEFEIERQSSLLETGGKVSQETRGWDDRKNETYSQRSKESSHDYRYYPDPDIPKMIISELGGMSKEEIQSSLPELPWIKRERYKKDFGMTDKEVAVFVESKEMCDYFEETISLFSTDSKKVKLTVNYLLTDYMGALKKNSRELHTISTLQFAELVSLIAQGELSSKGAKELIATLCEKPSSQSIKENATARGLLQKSDASLLIKAIEKIMEDNPEVVTEYKNGKTASLQYLIGQAMKATKGAGNPAMIKDLLIEKLS